MTINQTASTIDETSLTALVVERLVSFGYTPTDEDAWIIDFSRNKGVNHVLHCINRDIIPDGLIEVTVDMICGEFLNVKSMSGNLDLAGLDLSGAVESIKEGDTTVTFEKSGSGEEKIKSMIRWLIDGKGCDFVRYRKMLW